MKKILHRLQGLDFFDTFRHTVNYFGATVLINALGIISLPVYTYFLSTAGFGLVEIFNSLCKVGLALFTLNCYNSVFRYSFDKKTDVKDFVGSSIAVALLMVLFSGGFIFLFLAPLSDFLNVPKAVFPLVFPVVIANIFIAIFYQLYIAKKKSKTVSIVEGLVAYLRFFLAAGLLYWLGSSYLHKIYGDVIAFSMIGLYAAYRLRKHVSWNFKREHWDYMVSYSMPLAIGSLGYLLLSFFDQFMINALIGQAETGLYSFAYKIGMLLSGLAVALDKAAKADFFAWMNEKAYDKIESQVKSMAKLLTLGAAFLVLFAVDLGHLLASKKEFTPSLHLIPPLVVGFWFSGVYTVFVRGFQFQKNTYTISLIMVLSVVVNIVLNLIFMPIYGYEAAAYTTVASLVVMLGLCLGFNKIMIKNFPIAPIRPYLVSFVYLAIVVVLYFVILENLVDNFWLAFGLRSLIFGLLGLIFFGKKMKAMLNLS